MFLIGFWCLKNRYYNCEINEKEDFCIFNNKKFITCGIAKKAPKLLQIILWEHIFNLPADRDYLQVFLLSEEGGIQKIKHTQEVPEYCKEYVYDIDKPTTAKIFVIDDGTHFTMLLAEEY